MSNNYTETKIRGIINKINTSQTSSMTFEADEFYLAPDNAVYSVNNITPTNGNVSIPEGANKDLSNLSTTGNAKFQAPITGGASTITSSNLTTNRALVSNSSGKVAVSSVTLSELGYVSGVTSNIQTQLNNKVASNSAITGATKCKITYDSKGLVTGGTNLLASDIPDISSTYYLASNPNNYTDNVGTVTSVNNTSPDGDGNVSLTIPTVNNPTITITQGGTTKGSFTLNQSSGDTIDLDAGGGGTATDVQINGTSITSSNVANIVTNTAYNASSNKIATMSDVPTDYVTTNTAQNITADKTFTSQVKIGSTGYINCSSTNSIHTLTDFDLRGRGNTNYNTPRSIVSTGTSLSITKYGNTERTDFIIDGNTIYDGTTGLIPDARISNNIVKKVNNTSPDANGNVTVSASATWGSITGTLSNQTDLNTALTAKVSKAACATVYPVIQTYQSGTSWYRIYSDGWCEQGGLATVSATTGSINFVKTFADTNYFAILQSYRPNSYAYEAAIQSKTTSSMSWKTDATSNYVGLIWQACGYLAAGQY